MQKLLLSMLLAVSLAGFVKADDIMMTGPVAEKVKKEIVDLLMEDLKAFDKGGNVAADFIDRHEVDSILYLNAGGGGNQQLTKAQRVQEWRNGSRKILSHSRHDIRVRVYDNGNVAVADFINDQATHSNGKDQTPGSIHVLRVYVKNNGIWRTVVFDTFPMPK